MPAPVRQCACFDPRQVKVDEASLVESVETQESQSYPGLLSKVRRRPAQNSRQDALGSGRRCTAAAAMRDVAGGGVLQTAQLYRRNRPCKQPPCAPPCTAVRVQARHRARAARRRPAGGALHYRRAAQRRPARALLGLAVAAAGGRRRWYPLAASAGWQRHDTQRTTPSERMHLLPCLFQRYVRRTFSAAVHHPRRACGRPAGQRPHIPRAAAPVWSIIEAVGHCTSLIRYCRLAATHTSAQQARARLTNGARFSRCAGGRPSAPTTAGTHHAGRIRLGAGVPAPPGQPTGSARRWGVLPACPARSSTARMIRRGCTCRCSARPGCRRRRRRPPPSPASCCRGWVQWVCGCRRLALLAHQTCSSLLVRWPARTLPAGWQCSAAAGGTQGASQADGGGSSSSGGGTREAGDGHGSSSSRRSRSGCISRSGRRRRRRRRRRAAHRRLL